LVDTIVGLRTLRAKNNIKPHIQLKAYIENFDKNLKKYEDLIKRIVNLTEISSKFDSAAVTDVVGKIKI
jgi:valyl-tRNA synthetase